MGLLLSSLWENSLPEWENNAQIDYCGMIGEEGEWNPLQRLNLVPSLDVEIQTTSPLHHPASTSAYTLILVVTMPVVSETLKTVIDEMTCGTALKLVNL